MGWAIPSRCTQNKDARQCVDTLSIVLHDTPNNGGSGSCPKMLCADLDVTNFAFGELGYANEGTNADGSGTYTPELLYAKSERNLRFGGYWENPKSFTKVSGVVYNMLPSFTYPAHVHAEPCAAANGGPHYVRDISCIGKEGNTGVGCEATADTEFWVSFTTNRFGWGRFSTKITNFIARAGAQSVVIHQCLDAGGIPTASCASKPR